MAKTYSFPIPRALPLGLSASCILLLASFSGGATRNRGGLLEALNIGFLSYGHGRNLGLALYWVGIFLLAAAWVLAGRTIIRPQLKNPLPEGGLRDIQRILIAWVAPLLLAGPLASRDVYSYLMQGAMVRDGFDPYTEGAAVNPGPFLLEVSQDWRNTTTPYGPLHLWIGELVTSLGGDNVTAGVVIYKVLSLLGFIAIAWSIPRIARKLGADPAVALWLGGANPVIIVHLIGGMHNESLMVGLVSIGLLAALHKRFHAALILVGTAVAMKATAVIAAPFIVWMMLHHYAPKGSSKWRQLTVFVLSGIAAVAEIIAAVALITWVSGTSWGWLSQVSGNSKVINPLAGPTLATDVIFPAVQIFMPDASYNAILAVLRSIAMACMLHWAGGGVVALPQGQPRRCYGHRGRIPSCLCFQCRDPAVVLRLYLYPDGHFPAAAVAYQIHHRRGPVYWRLVLRRWQSPALQLVLGHRHDCGGVVCHPVDL